VTNMSHLETVWIGEALGLGLGLAVVLAFGVV
jgi:small basic protein